MRIFYLLFGSTAYCLLPTAFLFAFAAYSLLPTAYFFVSTTYSLLHSFKRGIATLIWEVDPIVKTTKLEK